MDSSLNHSHALAVVGDSLGDGEPDAHDNRRNWDQYPKGGGAGISEPIDKMIHGTILLA